MSEAFDVPRTPRPRERRLVKALVSGEAKTVSAALKLAGFHPSSQTLRNRLEPGGDLRTLVDEALDAQGLTLEFQCKKLRQSMDAKKAVVVDGEVRTYTEDNDAQLRANELAFKVRGITGKDAKDRSQGSAVTVNVLVMNENG